MSECRPLLVGSGSYTRGSSAATVLFLNWYNSAYKRVIFLALFCSLKDVLFQNSQRATKQCFFFFLNAKNGKTALENPLKKLERTIPPNRKIFSCGLDLRVMIKLC